VWCAASGAHEGSSVIGTVTIASFPRVVGIVAGADGSAPRAGEGAPRGPEVS
jgi:hypothetical protein